MNVMSRRGCRRPRVDELALERRPWLPETRRSSADLPHRSSEPTRDRRPLRAGRCRRRLRPRLAEELIHLACEDPRVDEGTDRLQPEACLSHLGDGADPPEQGVAPDSRISSPPLDGRRCEIDLRGERDQVLVHARPQRFHAEVGSDFGPGLQIGLCSVACPDRRMPPGRPGRGTAACLPQRRRSNRLHDLSAALPRLTSGLVRHWIGRCLVLASVHVPSD